MFDVTLVTDDGQHVQAHKIILSAGSNFFSDIFMKSNHSNVLVYLKGISSDKLAPVIDFIYNGEVFITQEHVDVFIETGKELKVKGTEGELTGIWKISAEKTKISKEIEHKFYDYIDEKASRGSDDYADIVDVVDQEQSTKSEQSLQLNEMIEKIAGVWICKVCGKTASQRQSIQRHAETHLGGMSHACHICSKTFTNTHRLSSHISGIHSELFSCDICGKTGMNRRTYNNHKQTKHI